MSLTGHEMRVLGCLIEKEMTTPDYYPLTLNSLMMACNQRSNRDPVTDYEEGAVYDAVRSLQDRGMCRAVHRPGQRTVKYRHAAGEVLTIDGEQAAVLAVLLLRGPQTLGEIRARTERYVDFADLAEAEAVLTGLTTRIEPLVVHLERRPGEKERRYRHLLGAGDEFPQPAEPPASPESTGLDAEIAELRERLTTLEGRFDSLADQLGL